MERLQKVIAAAGIASRRGAEELIEQGKVFVNDSKVRVQGTSVDPTVDKIVVNGKPLPTVRKVTYLLYKPKGVVCSRVRQRGEVIITDLVPTLPPVYPVGRLDKDSEGLILLTNDGDLANRLTHPSFIHSKLYLVHASWQGEEKPLDQVCHRLLQGVKLGDGKAIADKATAHHSGTLIKLEIAVHEGRNHLIRRMCAAVGLDVKRLVRLKIGKLDSKALQPGKHRTLTTQELATI